VDWVFVAFPVRAGGVPAAFDGVRALGIAAVTVTMPHKADAARACDELSDTAKRLGAVNAVLADGGRLVGDSTDGSGFLRSLADEGIDADGLPCVVLGAGGAARAITLALGKAGARVTVAARRLEAARDAAALAPDAQGIPLDAVDAALDSTHLLVNATPIGMGGETPPFDVARLPAGACVADTVYHPLETPLLAAARSRGLQCVTGLGMLVHQAALSFERFTGVDAPLEAMFAAAAGA
jgi:shikimate dehydrogenase